MADEGYKLQISVNAGKRLMVNQRADDVEEFATTFQALKESDSEFCQAVAALIENELFEGKVSKKKASKKSKDDDDEEENEEEEEEEEEEEGPTKMQLAQAKKLGLKGAKGMSRKELGTAIKKAKKKKAKKSKDDEDDDE